MIQRKLLIAFLTLLVTGQWTNAQSWDEVGVIQVPQLFSEAFNGSTVAIDGETAVSGSRFSDGWSNGQTIGTDAGIAHILKEFNGSWTAVFTLSPSDATGLKYFGHSVDISNNKVIVGAPGDADNGTNAGAAYIFELNGPSLSEVKLVPSVSNSYGQFGFSVAISGDYAIVGMPYHDTYTSGAAYVFEKIGGSWTETAILTPSDSATLGISEFGRYVAIDGNRIAVGDSYNDNNGISNTGAIYVFERNATNWNETAKLTTASLFSSCFLGPVSISGDQIIAGRRGDAGIAFPGDVGNAYVFEYDGTNWMQTADLEETPTTGLNFRLGSDVSISGDRAIVGTLPIQLVGGTPNESGVAFMYERINTTWTKVDSIRISIGNSNDLFGSIVAISNDLAVAGGPSIDNNGSNPNSGAIGVFQRTCPVNTNTSINGLTITAESSTATSYQWIDCNGNTAISGETNQTFTATTDGEYAVIITDGNCVDTSACIPLSTIGLNDLHHTTILVAPNPSTDGLFHITTSETIEYIYITDMSGRSVNATIDLNTNSINASQLEHGNYLLHLGTDSKKTLQRIQILR